MASLFRWADFSALRTSNRDGGKDVGVAGRSVGGNWKCVRDIIVENECAMGQTYSLQGLLSAMRLRWRNLQRLQKGVHRLIRTVTIC
jgi:hypothetical protein